MSSTHEFKGILCNNCPVLYLANLKKLSASGLWSVKLQESLYSLIMVFDTSYSVLNLLGLLYRHTVTIIASVGQCKQQIVRYALSFTTNVYVNSYLWLIQLIYILSHGHAHTSLTLVPYDTLCADEASIF